MHRPRPVALLTALLLLATFLPIAHADQWTLSSDQLRTVAVVIDGRPASFSGYIVNNRTVVPLRAIFETLGMEIKWNPDTMTVTATKGPREIILTVGEFRGKIDGQEYTLGIPPVLIDSKTFVPLRFVIDALQLDIKWDGQTSTVLINTGSGCSTPGPTVHQGTISPGGETWGKCGMPHIVTHDFLVEGTDSPILTVEAGVVIRFESGASIQIGRDAPGGLVVNGTESQPVLFTADSTGPQPGFWSGLYFHSQTLVNDTRIRNAKIEYAGGGETGAITISTAEKMVEIQLNDVTISDSLFTGLLMMGNGRLRSGSNNLTITKTTTVDNTGGFPIMTSAAGSHNLPKGTYTGNAVNAINIIQAGDSTVPIGSNTTWKNLGVPYAISQDVYVQGTTAPTLTIERGVITLWAADTALHVGAYGPGHLVADASARPEGSGEWKPTAWTDLAAWEQVEELASAKSLEPGCALCTTNPWIVFGAWNAAPDRGAWNGIKLHSGAGDKSKLVGTIIAYGGEEGNYTAGLYAEALEGKTVKFQLQNSLITHSAASAMEFYGTVQMQPGSTGNAFANSAWPVRLAPNNIGSLLKGQSFLENDQQSITVSSDGSGDVVSKSTTWWNHGIPYQFEIWTYIGGPSNPVVTVEPGTELLFRPDTQLYVGYNGMGSLVAVGTSTDPITFSGVAKRPGAWEGIRFSTDTGDKSRLEYVRIEYATNALVLDVDLGNLLRNSTIRNSSQMGIYRGYGAEGTSFLTGLGNQFEGNAEDENQE